MQIIIPMSGFGERFRKAGYNIPKPLIEIENKPIIAHVIDMFPGENNFIFICNQEHLDNKSYNMENILRSFCPHGKIIGIKPHKLGPIHAVLEAEKEINLNEPVIVNYCDFTCYWNWSHFKEFVKKTKCSGAIPAYKGFHPHSLGNTNYAYMIENKGWVEDIQEKQPYTNNRLNEYASSGTYYFSSGTLLKESFQHCIQNKLQLNGEYYVSLAYKYLFKKKLNVAVYPLQHFMQWGTPEDLIQYKSWSEIFKLFLRPHTSSAPRGSLVIPMAGLGHRFANEGYKTTKPLIPISGKPMVVQATRDLPLSQNHSFVLRKDMLGCDEISNKLKEIYPKSIIKLIDNVTEGQACSALIGLEALEEISPENLEPITFGACDNGVLFKENEFKKLLNNPEIDIIVWGAIGHDNAIRNPNMFGWIEESNGKITHISVKKPLSSPATDPIVIGTFTFKKSSHFHLSVESLIKRNGKINGEFYLDSCIQDAINLGLKCHVFIVDSYYSWGTPNDMRTFEYWQSCFHKWSTHPYKLDLDQNVNSNTISELEERYQEIIPTIPEIV